MKLGKITGRVWATIKDDRLRGKQFYVLQPIDEQQRATGRETIAVDTVRVNCGDYVYWVSAREATAYASDETIPCDCLIVGLVDTLVTAHGAKETAC